MAPHVDGERVVFLGAVGPRRRAEILGASTVLLHPIAFDEPCGRSVVESMACGTPVVAYARGSVPEVVDESVTGLLVHTVEQAVDAVSRVAKLGCGGCRARARQRFGAVRTVTDHLAVYDGLVRGPRRGSGRTAPRFRCESGPAPSRFTGPIALTPRPPWNPFRRSHTLAGER